MPTTQALFFGFLSLLLFGLGLGSILRQRALLRKLVGQVESPEETAHLRWRARRRVACGVVMILLGLLLGLTHLFLENPAQELANRGPVEAADPEHRPFLLLYNGSWIAIMLLLLTLVVLAGIDLWAVLRYGRRQWRQLQQDRRDMIDRETAAFRQQRNGQA